MATRKKKAGKKRAAPKKTSKKKASPKKTAKKTVRQKPAARNAARKPAASAAKKTARKSAKKAAPVKPARKSPAKPQAEKAPVQYPESLRDLTVQLTDGSSTSLSALSGPSGLVLYFYPKDDTPGCTIESCSFRDANNALKEKGFNIAGVSGDSPQSHQKFTSKYSLNFPLISDLDHSLTRAAGAWQEKSMYGKTYMGIARITMLLDPSLRVRKVYPKVRPDGHGEQVLADAGEL
jgi:peroxiredoxin Q/BCP